MGWKIATAVLGVALAIVIGLGAWQFSAQRSKLAIANKNVANMSSIVKLGAKADVKMEGQIKTLQNEVTTTASEPAVATLQQEYRVLGPSLTSTESDLASLLPNVSTLRSEVASLQTTVSCFQQDESYVWSGSFTC